MDNVAAVDMEPKPDSPRDHDGSQLGERGSRDPDLEGGNGRKRRLAEEEEGPKDLESLPEKKDLEEQDRQQEGTRISVPVARVGRRRLRSSMIGKRDGRFLDGAPWLVHVSSTPTDGKKEILGCSGTVIHWDKEKAWILTSYLVVFNRREERLYNPMRKLAIHVEKAVHLPNKGTYEGKMLFFSERYQFALIEVESDIEVKPPHDGSRPRYNEKVSILSRDKNLSLTLRRGTIKWDEGTFYLFVKCKFCRGGLGGPVINRAGELVAMSCDYNEDLPIISMTTIRACIAMWTKSGCIARPMLGMSFRTVKLLDIVRQDQLSYKYKISDGFIVDEVAYNCNAEKLGIRRGNVIRFSDVDPSCYLPEFEDYLLNIGMDFLDGACEVNDFKIEANDLVGKAKRTIILPLEITTGSDF